MAEQAGENLPLGAAIDLAEHLPSYQRSHDAAATLATPAFVQHCEAQLLNMIDARRRFESWRRQQQFRTVSGGFVRDGTRLEIRATLEPEPDRECVGILDDAGNVRHWHGKAHPRALGGTTPLTDLPLAGGPA
jgi:hypothetical protein